MIGGTCCSHPSAHKFIYSRSYTYNKPIWCLDHINIYDTKIWRIWYVYYISMINLSIHDHILSINLYDSIGGIDMINVYDEFIYMRSYHDMINLSYKFIWWIYLYVIISYYMIALVCALQTPSRPCVKFRAVDG